MRKITFLALAALFIGGHASADDGPLRGDQASNGTVDCMGIVRRGEENLVFTGPSAQPVIYGKVMD